jgi:hypothetical protein
MLLSFVAGAFRSKIDLGEDHRSFRRGCGDPYRRVRGPASLRKCSSRLPFQITMAHRVGSRRRAAIPYRIRGHTYCCGATIRASIRGILTYWSSANPLVISTSMVFRPSRRSSSRTPFFQWANLGGCHDRVVGPHRLPYHLHSSAASSGRSLGMCLCPPRFRRSK